MPSPGPQSRSPGPFCLTLLKSLTECRRIAEISALIEGLSADGRRWLVHHRALFRSRQWLLVSQHT
jgi:hypothetical protein